MSTQQEQEDALYNNYGVDTPGRQARIAATKQNDTNTLNGSSYTPDADMVRRANSYNYGRSLGQKEFYDDPDMKEIRGKREDLAKGYDGKELGAMRDEARGQVAGQRSNYLQSLQGKLARSGAGGARAAAVSGAADQKYAQQGAESERKLALDSSTMKRQGTNDLQDFYMRQKLGATGMAYGQQSLGASDYAAQQGVAASKSGGKK
jgi:hypothetical protein